MQLVDCLTFKNINFQVELSAHKLSAIYEILPAQRAREIIKKIEVVRTQVHGTWLNIAECELRV